MGRLSAGRSGFRLRSLSHLRDIIRLSPQAIADLNCHTRLLAAPGHLAYHSNGSGEDLRSSQRRTRSAFCPRPPSGYRTRNRLPPGVPLIGPLARLVAKGSTLAQAAILLATRLPAHYVILGERWSEKLNRNSSKQSCMMPPGPGRGCISLALAATSTECSANWPCWCTPARQEPRPGLRRLLPHSGRRHRRGRDAGNLSAGVRRGLVIPTDARDARRRHRRVDGQRSSADTHGRCRSTPSGSGVWRRTGDGRARQALPPGSRPATSKVVRESHPSAGIQ